MQRQIPIPNIQLAPGVVMLGKSREAQGYDLITSDLMEEQGSSYTLRKGEVDLILITGYRNYVLVDLGSMRQIFDPEKTQSYPTLAEALTVAFDFIALGADNDKFLHEMVRPTTLKENRDAPISQTRSVSSSPVAGGFNPLASALRNAGLV